eukprot:1157592-Pelagomonas_calceolata.AAC.4
MIAAYWLGWAGVGWWQVGALQQAAAKGGYPMLPLTSTMFCALALVAPLSGCAHLACLLHPSAIVSILHASCAPEWSCISCMPNVPLACLYRHIPQTQERILDAPDLVDDYYLNLLDWSCNNVVSAA